MYGQFNEVKIIKKFMKNMTFLKPVLNLVHMTELQIQILFIFGKKRF